VWTADNDARARAGRPECAVSNRRTAIDPVVAQAAVLTRRQHMRFLTNPGVALSVSVVLGAAPTSPTITVGPNVRVSRARPDLHHIEVLLAAGPGDPKRLIACSMIGRSPTNEMLTGVYASFDSGATWAPVVTEEEERFGADPTCTFGRNGTAYFA